MRRKILRWNHSTCPVPQQQTLTILYELHQSWLGKHLVWRRHRQVINSPTYCSHQVMDTTSTLATLYSSVTAGSVVRSTWKHLPRNSNSSVEKKGKLSRTKARLCVCLRIRGKGLVGYPLSSHKCGRPATSIFMVVYTYVISFYCQMIPTIGHLQTVGYTSYQVLT